MAAPLFDEEAKAGILYSARTDFGGDFRDSIPASVHFTGKLLSAWHQQVTGLHRSHKEFMQKAPVFEGCHPEFSKPVGACNDKIVKQKDILVFEISFRIPAVCWKEIGI
ncbi:MAG: hypothetical protein KJ645_03600, partial [Planctomycetes bacterium]|nr:hypothetical protein [Planctomycetota bacterium]